MTATTTLMLAQLLLLLLQSYGQPTTLSFPPNTATCIGGAANDAHLHPALITCTQRKGHWHCSSTALHDAFFRIHRARILCADACSLEYELDFTPLAVFAFGFLATILAGVFLAVTMYLAVAKMAGRYGGREEERIGGLRRPGYGSFGGRLYCLGHFSDSVKSLLELDVEGGERLDSKEKEAEDERTEDERLDWVAERIYLG